MRSFLFLCGFLFLSAAFLPTACDPKKPDETPAKTDAPADDGGGTDTTKPQEPSDRREPPVSREPSPPDVRTTEPQNEPAPPERREPTEPTPREAPADQGATNPVLEAVKQSTAETCRALHERCCDSNQQLSPLVTGSFGTNTQDCINKLTPTALKAAPNQSRINFDQTKFDACLDFLKKAQCVPVILAGSPCLEAFAPKQQKDDPCLPSECVKGLYCKGADVQNRTDGKCADRLAEGTDCSNDRGGCADGLVCHPIAPLSQSYKCTKPNKKNGDSCNTSTDVCEPPYTCAGLGAGTCRTLGKSDFCTP